MARNTAGREPTRRWPRSYTSRPPRSPQPPRRPKQPAADHQLKRRPPKSRVDEWMEVDFKFGGSRIKRKAVALVLLGAPRAGPAVLHAARAASR